MDIEKLNDRVCELLLDNGIGYTGVQIDSYFGVSKKAVSVHVWELSSISEGFHIEVGIEARNNALFSLDKIVRLIELECLAISSRNQLACHCVHNSKKEVIEAEKTVKSCVTGYEMDNPDCL